MTDKLDEILTTLENLVVIDTAQRIASYKSGQSPKKSHAEAKAAILAWHEAELERIIGDIEPQPDKTARNADLRREGRNQLRAEQRRRAGL